MADAEPIKNDAQVKAAECPEGLARTEFAIHGQPGLRLRVTRAGHKSWRVKTRAVDLTLGAYPAIGLAEAKRAAAGAIGEGARQRVNSRAKVEVLGREDRRTLRRLLDQFGVDRGASLKSWPAQRAQIEHHYAAALDRPAARLDRAAVLAPVVERRNVSAKRAATYLSIVLRHADVGEPQAQTVLSDLVVERPRERVLTDAEIAAVLASAPDLGGAWADFARALLLSAARRGDLADMQWADLDLSACVWSKRVHKTRGGVAVVRHPLGDALRALLERRRAAAGRKPSGPVFHGLANYDRHLKRLRAASGTEGWTFHDLRRTAATLAARSGVGESSIERMLDHARPSSVGATAATYNRYGYEPEMRAAYNMLADEIARVERLALPLAAE